MIFREVSLITRFKGFLRANAARIAVALAAVGCIIVLAVTVYETANDYENAHILVRPIAVGQKAGWLTDYRPVTFGDCPTAAPSATQPETTEPETTTQTAPNPEPEPASIEEAHPVYVEYDEPDEPDEPEEPEPSYEPEPQDSGSGRSLGYFTCVAYCGCPSCSEGYGSMTATGVYARPNHTIAVDPSVIPYGTWVVINGITYKAEDCGGDIVGHTIDIYFENHWETESFGRRTYEVFLA